MAAVASSSQVSSVAWCRRQAEQACGCCLPPPASLHLFTAPPAAPPRCPAAVFDGHGGFAAAEYLQAHMYRILTRVLDEAGLDMSQDMPGLACPIAFTPVLTDAFKHADDDLLRWMHGVGRGAWE